MYGHNRECKEMAFGLVPVVTVNRPSEQETLRVFFYFFFFLLLCYVNGDRSGCTCQCESCLPRKATNKPPGWLSGWEKGSSAFAAAGHTLQHVRLYCELFKQKGGLPGRGARAAGRVRKYDKNKEEKMTENQEVASYNSKKSETLTHKCPCVFSLLLFPQMNLLWRTYNKKPKKIDDWGPSLVKADSPLNSVKKYLK